MLFNLVFSYSHIRKGSSFDEFRNYRYVVTDSRSVFDPENTIFIAISTGIGDGRRFIPQLARQGVGVFIVENIPPYCYDIDATFVVVDDVMKTLNELAYSSMRGYYGGIMITGSIGKTVTKELLFNALNSHHYVRRSPRSWNSQIGFPLSVIDMSRGMGFPEIAIAEIGIDGPGQFNERCLSPRVFFNTGILTPITDEHDEAFPSHADKIRAKADLFSSCKDIFYADTDPEVPAILAECTNAVLHPVTQGDYPTIYHALAAAVIDFRGYKDADVREIPLVDKRREIFEGGYGNTIFHDHFTPDLRSLREALDFFRRHASVDRPHVLILGDMLLPANVRLIGEICRYYEEAFELARKFGVTKIYCLSEEYGGNCDFSGKISDDVEVCSGVMPLILSSYQNGKLLNDSQLLLFGKEKGNLKDFSESCMTAGHDTSLEVDLDALTHNYNYYRSLVPPSTGIIAMVKASAYGLGAVEIGKTLQSLGAPYLAVAVIDEGIALREAGITMPIMVLNPITNRYPALFANRLEPAVFSPDELSRLIEEAEKYGTEDYPIHIKFDTGMHRVGFLDSQLMEIARRLAATKAVKISSAFSHLATADCLDMDDYTNGQLHLFYSMADRLRLLTFTNFRRHILNTAGMMRFASRGIYDMARLGIGLYGITPYEVEGRSPLKTVATLRTHIISLKHWPAGTPIGYGCRGRVDRPSVVATIPIGYADGVNRHFGRGAVSFDVKGVKCPTLGNICMDLCMIDVTDVPDVKVGDSVEIFGKNAPVERLAEVLDTIPYEVLTSVSPRVKRVYFRR